MIQRRPILWATAPAVPEPAKDIVGGIDAAGIDRLMSCRRSLLECDDVEPVGTSKDFIEQGNYIAQLIVINVNK